MKKYEALALLTAIFTFGCARPENVPTSQPGISAAAETGSALSVFAATRAHEEGFLRAAATTLLRAARSLPPATAETCWREELARPAVRDLCLLLWAGGAEDSPGLSAMLLERAGQSPVAAAALVGRLPSLHALPLNQLREILSRLKEAPAWARARLILRWLEEHPGTDRLAAESLVDEIGWHSAASPLDLSLGFRATWKASRARFAERMKQYCDPIALGDSRLRCWRLLGTLADADQDPALAAQLRARLPVLRDSSWQLFIRAYPGLALRIQKNLEEK